MRPIALAFVMTVCVLSPASISVSGAPTDAVAGAPGHGAPASGTRTSGVPKTAPSGSEDKLPGGTFHVAYKSDDRDDPGNADISLELIVSQSDRRVRGVFQMTQPVKMWSHVDGSYTQASRTSLYVTSLTGVPAAHQCQFLGHGLPVFENARMTLRIEPSWQRGSADISYPADNQVRHVKWTRVSGVKLSGGVPAYWRGVTDVDHTSEATTMPWPTTCSQSSRMLALELGRLGRDESWRDLQLQNTVDADGPALSQWYVHNLGRRHILARYVCSDTKSQIADETIQVYPYENLFLTGFFEKDVCRLKTSHFD